MKKVLTKVAVTLMTAVMLLSMAGCATYKAPTSEQFCTALDELGYSQAPDASSSADITTVMMSFSAFGGGGYLYMKYDDPYDTSRTGYIRGVTEEVLCLTDKGTRYLLLVFDNNEDAKFYYDTMKNQIEDVTERDGVFITKAGINAECYTFAGTSPSLFGDEFYMYGGFYYKDNTVTIADTYENDIACKTQVNVLLDKLGLPRP